MIDELKMVSRPPLIAVLGCTGTVGAEVMRELASQACAVRGIFREPKRIFPVEPQNRPARISYVTANHGSVDQLSQAFIGADALFLSIGSSPDQVQVELNAIEAAQRVGVGRIIKLSAPIVAAPASVEVAKWHRAVEAKLAASGLEYCFLRPCAFMQNWLRNTYPIQHFGKISGSAGSAPRNYVDCRDVAAVATHYLLHEGPLTAHAIDITGSEVITNQEIAERLSLVTGAKIQYENLSRAEHYQLLLTRGKLPEWLARHIVELEELAILMPEQPTNTVQTILGRYPRTMDEFLQEHRMAFTQKRGQRHLGERLALALAAWRWPVAA